MLYQVSLPYAVFVIRVSGEKVVGAPSVAKWMVGKNFMHVCEWIAKKHGFIYKVEDRL